MEKLANTDLSCTYRRLEEQQENFPECDVFNCSNCEMYVPLPYWGLPIRYCVSCGAKITSFVNGEKGRNYNYAVAKLPNHTRKNEHTFEDKSGKRSDEQLPKIIRAWEYKTQ